MQVTKEVSLLNRWLVEAMEQQVGVSLVKVRSGAVRWNRLADMLSSMIFLVVG
jgi:hypothetical protein